MHPAVTTANEINIKEIRDFPVEEGLFDFKISFREQTYEAAARRMKPGIKNIEGGNSSVKDKTTGLSVPLIWIRPEQKPMAKLLHHKTVNGRKHNMFESAAVSIKAEII